MLPSFRDGDWIVASRFPADDKRAVRGDTLVFTDANSPSGYSFKRVVGLPGEELALSEGMLFIDGERLVEHYLRGLPAYAGLEEASWRLGADEFFVMGDNRAHSTDSRAYGPVQRNRLAGRARLRVWPVNRWGVA